MPIIREGMKLSGKHLRPRWRHSSFQGYCGSKPFLIRYRDEALPGNEGRGYKFFVVFSVVCMVKNWVSPSLLYKLVPTVGIMETYHPEFADFIEKKKQLRAKKKSFAPNSSLRS